MIKIYKKFRKFNINFLICDIKIHIKNKIFPIIVEKEKIIIIY